MKHIFQTIINLFLFINSSIVDFFAILWFGKLPKISIYHRIKYSFNPKQIYEDKDTIFNHYSNPNKYNLENFISLLTKNKQLSTLSFPLFDENGKKYGEQSFVSLIRKEEEKFKEYLNKQ
jgi:hypothetical protein